MNMAANESEEQIQAEFASCHVKGLGICEMAKRYGSLAEKYDEYSEILEFKTDIMLAKTLSELFPTERASIQILDLGCGTGRPILKALEAGFCIFDGVDVSERMLAMARKKNIYRRLIHDTIDGDHRLDIEDDAYDAALTIGGFGQNHIPSKAIFEFVRMVKPGGVIVIIGRTVHFETLEDYKINFERHLQELTAAGKLVEELRQTFVCAGEDCPGIVFVLRVL